MDPSASEPFDIAIVGAGPVGLLLANLLGANGLGVLLLERRREQPAQSQAIGITPPSLKILAKLGLQEVFIQHGVAVRDCHLHGESGHLGCVSFRDIPDEHRFILSLPQTHTVALLHKKLGDFANITLREGVEVTDVWQCDPYCLISYTDGKPQTVKARYVIACDGSRSPVRESLAIRTTSRSYPVHFVMGDFVDRTSLKHEAHLYFTAQGTIESFPLPGGLRRWIAQTPKRLDSPAAGLISKLVKLRTGLDLPPEDQLNQSVFSPRRLNCGRYHHGRIILCGDAAHVMSPIGGQGMNTGFADAEFLADVLDTILLDQAQAEPLLAAYHRYRSKAAQTAIGRAGLGMWFGTWTGKPLSVVRDFVIRHLLCRGPVKRHMGPYYAMLTIPYNTIERVPVDALKSQPA